MEDLKKIKTSGTEQPAELSHPAEASLELEAKSGATRKLGGAALNEISKDIDKEPAAKPLAFSKTVPHEKQVFKVIEPGLFVGFHDPRKLRSDANYVEKKRRDFERRAILEGPEAAARLKASKEFETMAAYGFGRGNWLGGVIQLPGGESKRLFSLDVHQTAEYDDYLNRADIVLTLGFSEPDPTSDTGKKKVSLPIAVDATISNGIDVTRDKLTKHYNDRNPDFKTPFGFTKLDYYATSTSHGYHKLVPRYIISLSNNDIKNIKKDANPATLIKNPTAVNRRVSLETRFKILSEFYAENNLYRAMLPNATEDMPEDDVRMLRSATKSLSRMNAVLSTALKNCVKEFAVFGNEEEQNIALESGGDPRKVLEFFLKKNHEKYHSTKGDSLEKEDPFFDTITMCDAMVMAVSVGALESWRTIRAHNDGIPREELYEIGAL